MSPEPSWVLFAIYFMEMLFQPLKYLNSSIMRKALKNTVGLFYRRKQKYLKFDDKEEETCTICLQ
jgi:hypothetical protein